MTHLGGGRVANLSTAIVTGAARKDAGEVRLASSHVVLDTLTSVVFREHPTT